MIVDPAHGDDAQRTLEQHALRNVQSLAGRLQAADAIDRRKDRAMLIGIGVVVAAVVIGLGLRMAFDRPDPRELERHRCQVDQAVRIVDRMRAELKQAKPNLTRQELEKLVKVTNSDVKAEAASACAGRN